MKLLLRLALDDQLLFRLKHTLPDTPPHTALSVAGQSQGTTLPTRSVLPACYLVVVVTIPWPVMAHAGTRRPNSTAALAYSRCRSGLRSACSFVDFSPGLLVS